VYKSLIYSGLIGLIISFLTTGTTSIGSLIAGYSAITLGLLLIIANIKQDAVSFDYKTILINASPVWLMLIVIGFILYLTITYYTIISEGHVSNSYYTFNNIIIILFLAQLGLLYKNNFDLQNFNLNLMSMVAIGVIQITICVLILYVILKYYTTDG
jgi:glucan phosphoethanolaminetransferase (alkaline phosphatase superfamily)